MPDWGQYLADLTLEFCRVVSKSPDRKGTLAVCLPRVEYAWCFAAMGVARSLSPVPLVSDHVTRLRPFIGHKVSFIDGADNEVQGELVSVPTEEEEQLVRVVVRRVADSKASKPRLGKASETTQLLDAKSWPSIKIISDRPQEEHAAFRFNAAPAVEVSETLLQFAKSVLGDAAIEWLCGPTKTYVLAYGIRSRMLRELKAAVRNTDGKERFQFGDFLKPGGKGLPDNVGRVRVLPSSDLHERPQGQGLPSLVIVEPSVRMNQLLKSTENFSRLLLLARNSHSYNDSALDLLEDSIRCAEGEFACAAPKIPPHIFHRSYYHA
jgi:hypothetical protein